MSTLVSIIIPAFNQLAYCRGCIESLRRCTPRPHRLILVDNGSTDGVSEYFDSVAGAVVVHTGRNLGFAGGVNAGLARAEGHAVLLNSDTVVTPGWLERLERALLSAPEIGLAGPRTNCAPGAQQISGLHLASVEAIEVFAAKLAQEQAGRVTDVTRLVGFCLMIREEALQRIGLFDERFEIGNFEDDDYCTRARQAGYRLVLAEDCLVFHLGGRTFAGMGLEGDSFQQLLDANRARYAAKWDVHIPAPPTPAMQAQHYREQAKAALEAGNPGDALRLLKTAAGAEPENPAHLEALASLLLRLGRRELAYELVQQAIALDRWRPSAVDLARTIAQALGKTAEFREKMRAHRPGRMIYFLCPDYAPPSGGVRAIYRQVDVLNAAGTAAAVLHHAPPFRCDWFTHETRITWIPECTVTSEDIVVLPEVYGPFLKDWFTSARRVIFNQNVYNTFGDFPWDAKPPYPYATALAALVVSEDNFEFMKHGFPEAAIHRIRYAIDPILYHYEEEKKEQFAFMPRKNESDARQVIHLLRARGLDLPLVPIEGRSAEDAAALLRESRFFLSFGHPEGFGLPAAEAMACGCIVIGYHGMGGREFLRVPYAYPIEHGDIVSFAGTVEALLPEDLTSQARAASAYILGEYSEDAERESILRAWSAILGGA